MYRKLLISMLAVALAAPLVARAQAHDDELDSEWGWIDEGDRVEEYDFAPGESVSFDTFHDGLTPYGQWITVGAYGRAWRPAGVAVGWRPYYYGNWEWTDEGWLWVSSEPWGWATYHYGRWAFDSFYGWVWVPGYQWAPAWVSWRYGPDYIGWAPLGPGLSVYVTNYPVVYDRWCFVPSARFVGYPVHSHAFVGPRVAGIYSRTQPAPPRATVHGSVAPAWGGPARPFVEQRVGRPIAPVRVEAVATPRAAAAAPRRDGVIQVYRPEAARPSRGGAATRSGAVSVPGRETGRAVSPLPGGAPAARPSPGANGGASRAAPARPGAAPRSQQPVQSAPPPAAAPPAAAPAPARPRPERVQQQSVDDDDGPGPRNYGGGDAAPARPSRGDSGGGGNRGGGGGGGNRGGGSGGRSGGHAVPNRR